MSLNIKNIALPTKSVEVACPLANGFKVTIGYISNELTRKLLKDAQVTKYDETNGLNYSEVDMELFAELFCEKAILGWSGLTIEGLSNLILIDTTGLELGQEVPFSKENAHELYRNCNSFSKWVSTQAKSLTLFRG